MGSGASAAVVVAEREENSWGGVGGRSESGEGRAEPEGSRQRGGRARLRGRAACAGPAALWRRSLVEKGRDRKGKG